GPFRASDLRCSSIAEEASKCSGFAIPSTSKTQSISLPDVNSPRPSDPNTTVVASSELYFDSAAFRASSLATVASLAARIAGQSDPSFLERAVTGLSSGIMETCSFRCEEIVLTL